MASCRSLNLLRSSFTSDLPSSSSKTRACQRLLRQYCGTVADFLCQGHLYSRYSEHSPTFSSSNLRDSTRSPFLLASHLSLEPHLLGLHCVLVQLARSEVESLTTLILCCCMCLLGRHPAFFSFGAPELSPFSSPCQGPPVLGQYSKVVFGHRLSGRYIPPRHLVRCFPAQVGLPKCCSQNECCVVSRTPRLRQALFFQWLAVMIKNLFP